MYRVLIKFHALWWLCWKFSWFSSLQTESASRTLCVKLNLLHRVIRKSCISRAKHHSCNFWANWNKDLFSECSQVKENDFWEPLKFWRDHPKKEQEPQRLQGWYRTFRSPCIVLNFEADDNKPDLSVNETKYWP